MQPTRANRRRRQRPIVTPLSPADELAARRVLTEAFIAGAWETDSWVDADRQAGDLIDRLQADGIELVAVRWS